MATTNTEKAMGLLNYGLISRMARSTSGNYTSESYPVALQSIIDIFGNRVKGGFITPDEIEDFQAHVSLVSVLDNHDSYPGIDKLPYYCQSLTNDYISKYEQSEIKRLG